MISLGPGLDITHGVSTGHEKISFTFISDGFRYESATNVWRPEKICTEYSNVKITLGVAQ